MRELALHLLDIAENSVAAQAGAVEISVRLDLPGDRLVLGVQDDGVGMDPETAARAVDPFHTRRTERKVGLGLPLLKAAAQASNGELYLSSTPGKGTRVVVDFQNSHIDRMPLGDLPGTFLALLVAHPEVNWKFIRQDCPTAGKPVDTYVFDDHEIKLALEDVLLSEPPVLSYLRETLSQGFDAMDAPFAAAHLSEPEKEKETNANH